MKVVIVLAMHGAPPTDFPRQELSELFSLRTQLKHVIGPQRAALEKRHAELDSRVRAWPRSAQNDPFYAASQEIAMQLGRVTGCQVVLGFNEFCAPNLDEAIEQAVARDADRVIVITPMMTRGGEHAEKDIPAAVQAAQVRHPGVEFIYAWPFAVADVAQFLAAQIARFTR
jgi:sirohydrochlorin cobaltochelatase